MDMLLKVDPTFWKAGREKTFSDWPFHSADNVCTSERMASAGFLYIGNKREPDLVECFICSKQLDGWEPNDDPWNEHVKHQSTCPFVKLNKCDENTWTVQDLFDLFKIYSVKECRRELDKAKMEAREESIKLASNVPEIYKEMRKKHRKRS